MIRMLAFFFIAEAFFAIMVFALCLWMTFLYYVYCKIFSGSFDLLTLDYFVSMLTWSIMIALGFSLFATNRAIDTGTFQGEVKNGIKR